MTDQIDPSVLVDDREDEERTSIADEAEGEEDEDRTGPDDEDESDQSEDSEESTDEPGDDAAEEAEEKPKKPKKGFQKRISELTRKNRQAESERDYWREQAMKSQPQQSSPAQASESKPEPEPREEDFESYEEYIAAKAEHRTLQKIEQRRIQEAKQSAFEAEQKAFESHLSDFRKRADKLAERVPDYWEMVNSAEVSFKKNTARMLAKSQNGPALVYYLATHDDVAQEISALSDEEAIYRLGQLEAKLTTAKPIKKNSTFKPLREVSGGQARASDPLKAQSDEEYYRLRTAQMKGKT